MSYPENSTVVVVTDPGTFDGDPFEVAERAARQAQGLARLLAQTIDRAATMGRNSFMERNLQGIGGKPRADEWEDSPQGRKYGSAHHAAKQLERDLEVLSAATGYNPKRPPKA